MNKSKAIIVILINLIIAFGFYVDNKDAGVSSLSSDLHNILPICLKMDNPELYSVDMVYSNFDAVKYYTPSFIYTWRFFAQINGGDYMKGINMMLFLFSLIYGICWFLIFFKFSNNFYLSLIFSIFIRGIVYIPGWEYWGIGTLWTLAPRTLYLALIPLPFYLYNFKLKYSLIINSLLVGLLFNLHPISGVAGALVFLIYVLNIEYDKIGFSKVKKYLTVISTVGGFILVGALPYVFTYFLYSPMESSYSQEMFEEALKTRISSSFFEPFGLMIKWFQLRFLFVFWIPLVLLIVLRYKVGGAFVRILRYQLSILGGIIVFILGIYLLENLINSVFDKNVRVFFQFVRVQKFFLIVGYFSLFYIFIYFIRELKIREYHLKLATVLFFIVLSVSTLSVFDNIPFIGDQVIRDILPDAISFGYKDDISDNDLDKMFYWMSDNTDCNALFHGPESIRSGVKRSVTLDYKGASMLIEGDPDRFVKWYIDFMLFFNMEDSVDKSKFLKKNKVDYWLIDSKVSDLPVLHKEGDWNLYKLN